MKERPLQLLLSTLTLIICQLQSQLLSLPAAAFMIMLITMQAYDTGMQSRQTAGPVGPLIKVAMASKEGTPGVKRLPHYKCNTNCHSTATLPIGPPVIRGGSTSSSKMAIDPLAFFNSATHPQSTNPHFSTLSTSPHYCLPPFLVSSRSGQNWEPLCSQHSPNLCLSSLEPVIGSLFFASPSISWKENLCRRGLFDCQHCDPQQWRKVYSLHTFSKDSAQEEYGAGGQHELQVPCAILPLLPACGLVQLLQSIGLALLVEQMLQKHKSCLIM